MSLVSAEFLSRWRLERETLTGGSALRVQRPVTKAYIREGRYRRNQHVWNGPEVNAYVVDGDNDLPWSATWHAYTDWVELPNVLSCELTTSIENKGTNAIIVVENASLEELSGFSGLYHAIERGWLAPWRGTDSEFTAPAEQTENEWARILDQAAQIKVWQGYGEDELVPTFLGFIDDLDLVSRPDQITIAARDTAQVIVDQRFYGWSKEVSHPDPVTFADRLSFDDVTRVGSDADASSSQVDHEPALVLDGDSGTRWLSDDHGGPDNTEWVEITIPSGTYESFRLNTENYGGMQGYVAINSVDGTIDGTPVADGWIDIAAGTVPDTSFEYVKTANTLDGSQVVRLPFTFVTTAETSRLRIAFRDLKNKSGDYRAGVVGLKAVRQSDEAQAHTEGWILVDDVSDIVRLILRWSGFKDWYVEDTGQQLEEKWVVNRESFLMDMIDVVLTKAGGFVFFINDPDDDDASLGFPVFRKSRSLIEIDADEIPVITESDLLQRVQTKFTTEPLPYNIRVRGRLATKDEGGVVVSRDARRLLAYYLPPWTTDDTVHQGTRTAGILKRTFLDRFDIKRQVNLDRAALLVALVQALAASAALVQTPANPGIELDQHVLLYDSGTGLNTRLWVDARSTSFKAGTEPEWTMSLNGALLDTPYMVALRAEIAVAFDET